MPDIVVRFTAVGQDQVVAASNKVASAAKATGKAATGTAGGFQGFTKNIGTAVAGVGLLTGGLFEAQDAFDGVSSADLRASRATLKQQKSLEALQKAQKAANQEMQGTTTVTRTSNGEVQTNTERILSSNKALGTQVVQRRNSNGEISVTTEKMGAQTDVQQKLTDAQADYQNKTDAANQATNEQTQAHQRLIPKLISSGGSIAAGAGLLGTFMSASKGAGGETTKFGASLFSLPGPMKIAGAAVIGLGVGLVALHENWGGVRDGANAAGAAIGKALPEAKPLLGFVKDVATALHIIPGDATKAGESVSKAFDAAGKALAPAGAALGKFATDLVVAGAATIEWGIKNVWPVLATVGKDLQQFWGQVVLAYDATVKWFNKYVWPALVEAYKDLSAFWGNVVTAYNATVNWFFKYIYPVLQQVWSGLVQFWGNAVAAYNATINWFFKYVYPVLQQVWTGLVNFWGNAVAAYNATINWFFRYVYPVLQQVWSGLVAFWGAATATYNGVVNWFFRYVFPVLQQVWNFLTNFWGNPIAAYNAIINWAFTYHFPTLAEAEAGLRNAWGNINWAYNAAIKFLSTFKFPTLQEVLNAVPQALRNIGIDLHAIFKIGGAQGGAFVLTGSAASKIQQIINVRKALARQQALAPTIGGTKTTAAEGGSFIVNQPTRFGNLTVGEGHKPELLTFIPFGGASGGGILNVTPLKGSNAPKQTGMANGGNALAMGSWSGSSSSSNWDNKGGGGSSVEKLEARFARLIAILEKMISVQSKGLQANLFVDGQRMASVTGNYLSSKAYGDR